MPRWTVLVVGVLLLCVSTSAALAQEPAIRILETYTFDPTEGKQQPRTEFNWPRQVRLSALVRFSTEGYERRKTVELFLVLTDRNGDVVHKHSRELTLHTGEHEYVMPYIANIGELYRTERFSLEVEAKLVGANRVTDQVEAVVNGPAMPEVIIQDLRLVDPASHEVLTAMAPGQQFMAQGMVTVRGNTTPRLPTLAVWGLMSKDELIVERWDDMPYSDCYWDQVQLAEPNGRWQFSLAGQMPDRFIQNIVESQPYELTFTVAFIADAAVAAKLSGTVLASGSGELVSKSLDERLITLERNWHWEVAQVD